MTKFNTTGSRAGAASGPIAVDAGQPMRTAQGGQGFGRDDKSDLMLLATTSIDITADAFYEQGDARVKRLVDLSARIAVADPDWMYRFVTWLRTKGNMRTAALVAGIEAAYAMTKAGIPGGRHLASAAIRRADEPGEALAYARQAHGRNLPMAVKRGIGDGATRVYNEFALLKYDTASKGYRFGDVLAVTHAAPDPGKPWQAAVFRYAIDRRYGRTDNTEGLRVVQANQALRAQWASDDAEFDLDPQRLRDAGMTWEDTLSAIGGKTTDQAALWRNLIASGQLGLMAAIRNLRNMDEAGLTDADVRPVIDMLMDRDTVLKSKQLPLRFLSAYRAAGHNLRWAYALETALGYSIGNIPALTGSTLILIDTSQSMDNPMSDRSGLKRWDAAVAFGLALAARCAHADVVSYSDNYYGKGSTRAFPIVRGESLLTGIKRFGDGGYFINAGTDTAGALRKHYNNHDRVIILTDEQTGPGTYGSSYKTVGGERHYVGPYGGGDAVGDQMPANRPMTTINLAGYTASHAATDRNRLTIGGLTDQMFGLIASVEQGRPGNWPWTGDPDIPALPVYGPQVGPTATEAGMHRVTATVRRSTVPEDYMGGDGPWSVA